MAEGMRAALGTIIVEPQLESKTKGGIILKDMRADTAGTYQNTRKGKVVACGIYQDRQGVCHPDYPDFPLPPGSYVEHATYQPFLTADQLHIIRSPDLVRWAPPGDEPSWW